MRAAHPHQKFHGVPPGLKYILKSHNKAKFSPVEYLNPADGGLHPGGLIIGRIFLFPC